jgi:hypothetical protein
LSKPFEGLQHIVGEDLTGADRLSSKESAEGIIAGKETADSSGLKPFGMTKHKGL